MVDVERLSNGEIEEILRKAQGEYTPSFVAMPGWEESPTEAIQKAHDAAKNILYGRRVRVTKRQMAKHIVNMYHAYRRLEKGYADRPTKTVAARCQKLHLGEATTNDLIEELKERTS